MTMMVFPPGSDPGPSFVELLRRSGSEPQRADLDLALERRRNVGARGQHALELRHGTTILSLRYLEGVVIAGDRRATEGHAIAHRAMEKVFPADRLSAVAIAGTAGPAMDMVRLFQTQLEHYEKVEGVPLTLEGKANQLAQMVRAHLPLAMEGLAVVPLFAGFDDRRGAGRIFTYDVVGGRYEESDFNAIGSGGRDARTTIKLGYRADLDRDAAVELAVEALFQAADEDAATGGPDPVRGIYPIVATVTQDGYEPVSEDEVSAAFARVVERRSPEHGRRSAGGGASGTAKHGRGEVIA